MFAFYTSHGQHRTQGNEHAGRIDLSDGELTRGDLN